VLTTCKQRYIKYPGFLPFKVCRYVTKFELRTFHCKVTLTVV